jgi:hypothetical protein
MDEEIAAIACRCQSKIAEQNDVLVESSAALANAKGD